MGKVRFDIISTGSHGNAVVIEDSILIDCGVAVGGSLGCLRLEDGKDFYA